MDLSEMLSELRKEMPEIDQLMDALSALYLDGEDEETDEEYYSIEIDGTDYLIYKEFTIGEDTYYYLANLEEPTDVMLQKRLIEDGEEYMVGLDDEEEFDLAFAYVQKLCLTDLLELQKKREARSADTPDSE